MIEMGRTAIVIILLGIIIFLGCAKDIIVKPPTTLRGVYQGEYCFTDHPGSGQQTECQWITWTFTDYNFYMDAARTDERPPFTCDKWYGTYRLESNIIFDTCIPVGLCNPDHEIKGVFNLLRREDTLFISQTGPLDGLGPAYQKDIIIVPDTTQ
jgi:hypothetical protein